VSVATDDDLRGANTEYNSFISDHYLQLPPTLPERVRNKAEEIAGGLDNPMDKALAIQDYLRGPEFTYSQDIDAPPRETDGRETDGVDHFLFVSKEGYSDYFGSAMTVMLRAVGVPARLAAGYAPGEFEPNSEIRFIKDSDSHGWAQAYFPEYGWIDFEPTPNWPEHERVLPESIFVDLPPGFGENDPLEVNINDLLDPAAEGFEEEGAGGGAGFANLPFDVTRFLVPTAIVVGTLAVIALLARFLWNLGLGGFSTEERLYAKMSRLGFIAGLRRRPHQTPWEYALVIGQAVPSAADGVRHISARYAAARYGRHATQNDDDPDDVAVDELNTAWNHARWSLIGRAFGRLAPMRSSRQPAQAR